MIPHPERAKGGAAPLGADSPSQYGPFGQAPLPARPVLDRWLRRAHPDHLVLVWQEDHAGALDAFEELLSGLEAHGAQRWKAEQADFASSKGLGALLIDRAEYVLARAMDAGRIVYRLGDTKIRNPDFILASESGELGIEVTGIAPAGVTDLCEQVERDVLAAHEEFGVCLVFSGYPSRVLAAAVTAVCDAGSPRHRGRYDDTQERPAR
ncbi:hypothetical protein [Streptomyces sp. NPDC002209]|uniref:hypothetical protein n=1 Tax=Streptomyces sp. NPDC002209 TaxID=3364638 RepID=UPI0036CC9132